MSLNKAWCVIALATFTMTSYATTNHTADSGKRLVGEWQQGLNHETKSIPTIEAFSLLHCSTHTIFTSHTIQQ